MTFNEEPKEQQTSRLWILTPFMRDMTLMLSQPARLSATFLMYRLFLAMLVKIKTRKGKGRELSYCRWWLFRQFWCGDDGGMAQ
ncbi:MAG UNVERIFIED_CONTAM: hypothetical protein LVR29_12010 [Microcystis novacekii LVE1205-3]